MNDRFWHLGDMTKYANEGRFQPGSGHSCAGPSRARLRVHGLKRRFQLVKNNAEPNPWGTHPSCRLARVARRHQGARSADWLWFEFSAARRRYFILSQFLLQHGDAFGVALPAVVERPRRLDVETSAG